MALHFQSRSPLRSRSGQTTPDWPRVWLLQSLWKLPVALGVRQRERQSSLLSLGSALMCKLRVNPSVFFCRAILRAILFDPMFPPEHTPIESLSWLGILQRAKSKTNSSPPLWFSHFPASDDFVLPGIPRIAGQHGQTTSRQVNINAFPSLRRRSGFASPHAPIVSSGELMEAHAVRSG